MTIASGCAPDQRACKGKDISDCLIVEFDGQPIHGGDIAELLALEKAAGAAPINLTLEGCKVGELELHR